MSSSKTRTMTARINKAFVSGNKVHCSIPVPGSYASNNEMLMKFNYPPQNKTNMRKVGTLHTICGEMDRLWRMWFSSPPPDFTVTRCHLYYQHRMRLFALQRWAHVSLWERDDMNPISSDKASSSKSSHPKKLITDTSKNVEPPPAKPHTETTALTRA